MNAEGLRKRHHLLFMGVNDLDVGTILPDLVALLAIYTVKAQITDHRLITHPIATREDTVQEPPPLAHALGQGYYTPCRHPVGSTHSVRSPALGTEASLEGTP